MNPTLASQLEWTLPEGAEWMAYYAAFLGAGCALICCIGLLLLLHEAWQAWNPSGSRPSTWQAEFMGFGVAKERCPARRVLQSAPPHPSSAAAAREFGRALPGPAA